MTQSIGELRHRVYRLKNETPRKLSPLCLSGCTVGFREAIEDVLTTVHEVLDLLAHTYATLEGVRVHGVKNDDDYRAFMND